MTYSQWIGERLPTLLRPSLLLLTSFYRMCFHLFYRNTL
jgi:hypothetical protein